MLYHQQSLIPRRLVLGDRASLVYGSMEGVAATSGGRGCSRALSLPSRCRCHVERCLIFGDLYRPLVQLGPHRWLFSASPDKFAILIGCTNISPFVDESTPTANLLPFVSEEMLLCHRIAQTIYEQGFDCRAVLVGVMLHSGPYIAPARFQPP